MNPKKNPLTLLFWSDSSSDICISDLKQTRNIWGSYCQRDNWRECQFFLFDEWPRPGPGTVMMNGQTAQIHYLFVLHGIPVAPFSLNVYSFWGERTFQWQITMITKWITTHFTCWILGNHPIVMHSSSSRNLNCCGRILIVCGPNSITSIAVNATFNYRGLCNSEQQFEKPFSFSLAGFSSISCTLRSEVSPCPSVTLYANCGNYLGI